MTNTTISRSDFEDALQDAGYESLYEGYSGRGMFGATCIGVVTGSGPESVKRALLQAAERIREEDEADRDDLADILEAMAGRMSWDNLGFDLVVYFPGFDLD